MLTACKTISLIINLYCRLFDFANITVNGYDIADIRITLFAHNIIDKITGIRLFGYNFIAATI